MRRSSLLLQQPLIHNTIVAEEREREKCFNTIGDTFHGSMITYSTADYIMYTLDTSSSLSHSLTLSPSYLPTTSLSHDSFSN